MDMIVEKISDQLTRIKLTGRLNAEAVDVMSDNFFDAVHGAHSAVVVDVGDLNYISSAGLGLLLRVAKDGIKQEQPLYLFGCNGEVEQVIRMSGLIELFLCPSDMDEIEDALKNNGK